MTAAEGVTTVTAAEGVTTVTAAAVLTTVRVTTVTTVEGGHHCVGGRRSHHCDDGWRVTTVAFLPPLPCRCFVPLLYVIVFSKHIVKNRTEFVHVVRGDPILSIFISQSECFAHPPPIRISGGRAWSRHAGFSIP